MTRAFASTDPCRALLARAVALALALCGCGGSSPPPATPPAQPRPAQDATTTTTTTSGSRAPTPAEAHAIGELERAAEQIRGLRFVTPVPVLVQNRDAITGYVESQIEEDAISRGRALYVALGLLPADLDVRAQLLQLLGEQILGYYDAEQKHLVVRDDVMQALGKQIGAAQALEEARLVLVHELVHALQDQHLKLSVNIEHERTSDAENAFRSLIEGDATLAMIGYMLEASGVPLRQLTSDPSRMRALPNTDAQEAMGGEHLASAPAILRVPLLSAYRDGLSFCAHVHSRGGWTGVDMAHDNPPLSTEHVLHPEKWSSGQLPDEVAIGAQSELDASGYQTLETTTLGELEASVYFEQGQSHAAALKAAAGWGGDQVRVYRGPQGDTPVVWYTSWDDNRQAAEAETAAQQVQRASSARSSGHRVQRVGRAVLILRHVPEAMQAGIGQRFSAWASRLPATPPQARAGR